MTTTEVDNIFKFYYTDLHYEEYDQEKEWNFNSLQEAMEIVEEKQEDPKRYKKLRLEKVTYTRVIEELEI